MDSKEIRELAAIMKETGLSVLDYKDSDVSIRLERTASRQTADAGINAAPVLQDEHHIVTEPVSGYMVRSPMVGVFYAAPGTNMEQYVNVGDPVHEGDVLCIIEAMKIMNEIMAERDGIIAEIYVANKQVVEYNQPMFRISTDL